jgi:hypothetical protein
VQLREADERLGAMLIERCLPGTELRELPEPEQETVIAGTYLHHERNRDLNSDRRIP